MGKVAVITGVTGQDGACLAEFLLEKSCEMRGLKRSTSLADDNLNNMEKEPS